jgi:preprotein translocase subunit SecG
MKKKTALLALVIFACSLILLIIEDTSTHAAQIKI